METELDLVLPSEIEIQMPQVQGVCTEIFIVETIESLDILRKIGSTPPDDWITDCCNEAQTIQNIFTYQRGRYLLKEKFVKYFKIFPWMLNKIKAKEAEGKPLQFKQTLNPDIKYENPRWIEQALRNFWTHGIYSEEELNILREKFSDDQYSGSLSNIVRICEYMRRWREQQLSQMSPHQADIIQIQELVVDYNLSAQDVTGEDIDDENFQKILRENSLTDYPELLKVLSELG